MDGQELVEVANGQVAGKLVIQAGEESPEIAVEWRDDDGGHFHGEDLDEDLSLGHTVGNESVAGFEVHANEGRWVFHIHGNAVGTTTLELQLFNIDHVDFRTPPITIEGERSRSSSVKPTFALEGGALRQKLGATMAETLDDESGIEMRSMGPAPARPVLREMGSERLLVLEDGG